MIWSYYSKSNNKILNSAYSDELSKIYKWIAENDLNKIRLGKHIIDGENLYVNILQYETKDETDCIWEAHRQYLDLHYIISGQELIEISDIRNMFIGEYEEDKDYVHINGDYDTQILCKSGSLLLLTPEDAHKTAVKVAESDLVKKAVFKIIIQHS